MSHPYSISENTATVIAHICCFEGVLPQGAPTSPLISNMICWKMDRQLSALAGQNRFTYSRYADDITFSSTQSKKVPRQLAVITDDNILVGDKLQSVIAENGFEINTEKVRFRTQSDRMEVTGLTVNDNLNVSKKYYKQIRSMLYAWQKFGLEAAQKEHHEKFYKKYRPSGNLPSLPKILHGKLLFLQMVKGKDNKKYVEYAKLFNQCCPEEKLHLNYEEIISHSSDALKKEAMFIIEACYNNEKEEASCSQGTGFYVENVGMITCEHVLRSDVFLHHLKCFRPDDFGTKYRVEVVFRDEHHDLAVCKLYDAENEFFPSAQFNLASSTSKTYPSVELLGFPCYKIGSTLSIVGGKITSYYPKHGFNCFEVDIHVRSGFSGGPFLDDESKVVGMAVEGGRKDFGQNAALTIDSILNVFKKNNISTS